jgi:hypothetical protein
MRFPGASSKDKYDISIVCRSTTSFFFSLEVGISSIMDSAKLNVSRAREVNKNLIPNLPEGETTGEKTYEKTN